MSRLQSVIVSTDVCMAVVVRAVAGQVDLSIVSSSPRTHCQHVGYLTLFSLVRQNTVYYSVLRIEFSELCLTKFNPCQTRSTLSTIVCLWTFFLSKFELSVSCFVSNLRRYAVYRRAS